ncbi:putative enterotoxin [Ophiocordyceps australis]|uniref:Putative enterotoxin n=1 Tax=Ophiocordyceps australis TaxID=1399860 RepID=A0A2C5YIR4_9HYPO|nr:putative enterotoxin [Ophiocordyceps australis]
MLSPVEARALPGGLLREPLIARDISGSKSAAQILQRRQSGDEPANSVVTIVYRGDTRSPEQLRQLGGFPTEFEGPLRNESYSLIAHHEAQGEGEKFQSAYTSTARLFGSTVYFATDAGKQDGWVYKIHATPNMIDMNDSGFLQKYARESEFSAMGGVRWDQIQGWVPMPRKAYPAARILQIQEETARLRLETLASEAADVGIKNATWPRTWIDNVEYNQKYEQYNASKGQPQLAGDAANLEKHGDKTLEEHARDFMRQNGAAVGWDERYFPFISLAATAPAGPWKGPFALNSEKPAY